MMRRTTVCCAAMLMAASVGFAQMPSAPVLRQRVEERTNVTSVIIVLRDTSAKKSVSSPQFSGVKNARKLKISAGLSKKGSAPQSRAAKNLNNMYKAELADDVSLDDALAELSRSPDVLYAEPDYRVVPLAAPNDTCFSQVWALNNTGQPIYTAGTVAYTPPSLTNGTPDADTDWLEAYEAGLPTNQILVAVIDTGVDYTHPELAGQMWTNPGEIPDNGIDDDGNHYVDDVYGIDALNGDGDPMDDHAHGTHCSGTIAALGNNNKGIIGANPAARIMACKFLGGNGGGTADAIECVYYAVMMGAKILSNSWGGGDYSQALQDAITYANEQGVWFIAAAGNSDTEAISYPAGYDGVTAVAATDAKDERADFSNYGFWVDVAAPGVDILSLRTTDPTATRDPDEQYYWTTMIHPVDTNLILMSGTSMACPLAAGEGSLLAAKRPGFAPWIYSKVMRASCDTNLYSLPANLAYHGKLGAGRINVNRMLSYAETNAFIESALDVEGGFSAMVLSRGASNGISVKVGTWLSSVTGLTVRATVLDNSTNLVTLSQTNATVGDLSATSVTNLPSAQFVATVATNAPMGQWAYIRFELLQGETVLDRSMAYVGVARKAIEDFRIVDLDLNGISELVAYDGNALSAYDAAGSPLWSYEPEAGSLWGPVSGMAVGNVDDSTPEPEIVLTRGYWNAAYSTYDIAIQVVSHDGTPLYGPTATCVDIQQPVLADMNGDGVDDIVVTRLHQSGLTWTYVNVYTVSGGSVNLLWQRTASTTSGGDAEAYRIEPPAVGDLDGDGSPEVVCFHIRNVRNSAGSYDAKMLITKSGAASGDITLPSDSYAGYYDAPVIGDLDADGFKEIVFNLQRGSSSTARQFVYVYKPDGRIVDGWPVQFATGVTKSRDPVLADADGSGRLSVLMVDTFDHRLNGWSHDGAMLPFFPVEDANLHSGVICADLDGDAQAEIAYLGGYVYDTETEDYSFVLTAREFDGTLLRGFPRTYSGQSGYGGLMDVMPWAIGSGPLSSGTFTTNLALVFTADSDAFVYDTGFAFSEAAQEWPVGTRDAQNSRCYQIPSGKEFAAVQMSNPQGFIATGSGAVFTAAGQAGSGSNLTYLWDFDGDGIIDATGTTVTQTFSSAGSGSVRLTVSNQTSGAVFVTDRPVTVYDPLVAAFSASATNIPTAPALISFTDESLNNAQAWSWSFGDGATSTEQNPQHLYTNAGSFTVSLTVSNDFGAGMTDADTVVKTGLIVIGGTDATLTNHYVSLTGRHIYPFTSWEKAATNVQAAIDACATNDHAVVTNGVYAEGGTLSVTRPLTLRSVNGAAATVLDGAHGFYDVLYVNPGTDYGAVIDGFTVRNGEKGITGWGGWIRNCVVADNEDTGISMTSAYGDGRVEDTVIEGNLAGGAFSSGTILYDRCTFRNNRSFSTNTYIFETSGSGTFLRNSLFCNNTNGGVLYLEQASDIENLTVVDNHCTIEPVYIFSYAYPAEMRNVICWSNGYAGAQVKWEDYYNPTNTSLKPVKLMNCSIQGGVSTAGLINAESGAYNLQTNWPEFLNYTNGDYRLATNSPCVDSGYNLATVIGGSSMTTVRVDFGSASLTTPGNWNNITNTGLGTWITNAITSEGADTGWQISCTRTNFLSVYTGATTNEGIYPLTAQRDGLRVPQSYSLDINSIFPVIRLDGLNPDSAYTIRFFGSSTNNTHDTISMVYPVGSYGIAYKRNLATYTNTASEAVWTNLVPQPDGSISVEIELENNAYSYGAIAVLSAMEITEITPLLDYAYTDRVDLVSAPRVAGTSVDRGAYELQDDYLPVAQLASSGLTGAAPFTVWFTNSSTATGGTITNTLLDFGDGSAATNFGTSVAHLYSQPGTYPAKLTVSDSLGQTVSASLSVEVSAVIPDAPQNLQLAATAAPTEIRAGWIDASSSEDGFILQRTGGIQSPSIILDNTSPYVTRVGSSWSTSTSPSGYYGSNYSRNNGNGSDPGVIYAEYKPPLTATDRYNVYIWYPASSANCTRAYVYVMHADGQSVVLVDQRVNGSQWVWLGEWNMGPDSFVSIDAYNNLSASMYTVADAIKFEPADSYQTVAQLPAGSTNWIDGGLTPDRTYRYRVAATNSNGSSAWTGPVSFDLPSTNAGPVAALSANVVTGYVPLTVQFNASASSDADGAVTNFLWVLGDNYSGSIQKGAALTGLTYRYDYAGVYTARVTVADNQGVQSTTGIVIHADGVPPGTAPDGLSAVLGGEWFIDLSWNDRTLNDTGFEIQRKASGGSYATIGSTDANTLTLRDSSVEVGYLYTYRVRATNSYGVTDWSAEASAEVSSPDYELPFSEPFETLNSGALSGQHGWTATSTNAAVHGGDVHGGSQALRMQNVSASHSFNGAPTNVTVSFYAKPQPQDAPGTIPAGSEVVFWMSETNGVLLAYSNSALVAAGVSANSNDWNFFEVVCDYSSKQWTLSVNGTNAPISFGFYTGTAGGFSEFRVQEQSETGFSWLDDINIAAPVAGDDADSDGLPDSWEEQYYGSSAPNPEDLCANGINTVREAYIAGFDPTDASAGFGVSNVRNLLWWNSASGRVYTVYWSSNLLSSFNEVLHSNVTGGAFTDTLHSAEQKGFYRLEVQLAP